MNPRLGIVSPSRQPKLNINNIANAVIDDVNKNSIINSLADFNLGLPIPTQIKSIDQVHLHEQQQPIGGIVDIAQRSPSRSLTPALHSPTNDRLTPRDIAVIEKEKIDINKMLPEGARGAHGKRAGLYYNLRDMKAFLTEMGRRAPTDVTTARSTLYAILQQYEQGKESKNALASLNI